MKNKGEMSVVSYVELSVPAEERHLRVARSAAESLTSNKTVVSVEVSKENPKLIVTTFPMARARQLDVVDRIAHVFAMDMEDYADQSIGFPKSVAEERRDKRKLERAKERRRERRAARESGDADFRREIPRELVLVSRQVEQLIRPMGFSQAQRVQFFVLLQIAMIGRVYADHGCASLAQAEADRIYELAHEFALPKNLICGDEGFYRGRVYELVRFAELQVDAVLTSADMVPPRECVATDIIMAVQNLHALLREYSDGSDLEPLYRRMRATLSKHCSHDA